MAAENSTTSATGIVEYMVGNVYASSPDRVIRFLKQGDEINVGETVLTGISGNVVISVQGLEDVTFIMGSLQETVFDDQLMESISNDDFIVIDTEIEEIKKSMLNGDFDSILERFQPAAGTPQENSAGGGTYQFREALTAEEVTPTSGAETEGIDNDFTGSDVDLLIADTISLDSTVDDVAASLPDVISALESVSDDPSEEPGEEEFFIETVGASFGYSSYTNTADDDNPPEIEFDVLADAGLDPAMYSLSSPVFSEGGDIGSLNIVNGKVAFTPGADFSGQTEITYTITDSSGTSNTGLLTVNERFFKIGTNTDDDESSTSDYHIGVGAGVISGGVADDILIGDLRDVTPVFEGSLNMNLILDTSGSMSTLDRIEDLKLGVSTFVRDLGRAPNQDIRLHITEFSSSASTVGVYDIWVDGEPQDITGLLEDIDTLAAQGGTNFEAAFRDALNWADGKAPGVLQPLTDAENVTVFFTDGSPNADLSSLRDPPPELNDDGGRGGTITNFTDQLLDPPDSGAPAGSGYDTFAEVSRLQEWGNVRVLRLGSSTTEERENLQRIDSEGKTQLLNSASDISSILPEIFQTSTTSEIGSDEIDGGSGDDVIIGDALDTDYLLDGIKDSDGDTVWAGLKERGLVDENYQDGLTFGSGWLVFEALEQNTDWTRTDTINFIEQEYDVLARINSSYTASNGSDILYGGEGDDAIYGQLSDDQIDGEAGDDFIRGDVGNDTLLGSEGDDVIEGGRTQLYVGDFDTDRGADRVDGGAGDDSIDGGRGDDILRGGSGDDYIISSVGENILIGDAGDDYLRVNAGRSSNVNVIIGSEGDDTILGTRADDILVGGAGQDTITGGAGNDILIPDDLSDLGDIIDDGDLDIVIGDGLLGSGDDDKIATASGNYPDPDVSAPQDDIEGVLSETELEALAPLPDPEIEIV